MEEKRELLQTQVSDLGSKSNNQRAKRKRIQKYVLINRWKPLKMERASL